MLLSKQSNSHSPLGHKLVYFIVLNLKVLTVVVKGSNQRILDNELLIPTPFSNIYIHRSDCQLKPVKVKI